MKYKSFYQLYKEDEDAGIDLASADYVLIKPGEIRTVDTSAFFDFPIFGPVRRFLTRVVFGIECTGIGAIIKPRSRNDYAVLAGVVDQGYRGQIKVKIHNVTDAPIHIPAGERFAQMVLIPSFNPVLMRVADTNTFKKTRRGSRGGINVRR